MPEQKGQRSFDEVFNQKKADLEQLVKSYGGIMVGHPSAGDVEALAMMQARYAMEGKLSPEDAEQGEKLAAKFKGSFC